MKEGILGELSHFVNLDQRGWITVGKTRMALIDILQGFYKVSAIFRNEVGENAPYVIYQIAKEAGTSFHEPLLTSGSLKADATGFQAGVYAYSEAGFGDFQIKDLNWEKGWARIQCRDTFEGWAYHGEPVYTIVRGHVVMAEGHIVGAPQGKFVPAASRVTRRT